MSPTSGSLPKLTMSNDKQRQMEAVPSGAPECNMSILALNYFNKAVVLNREVCSRTLKSTHLYSTFWIGGVSCLVASATGMTEGGTPSTIPPAIALLMTRDDYEKLSELAELVSER